MSITATGHYEVRDHPSIGGLVVIWWSPDDGPPAPTNMTFGADRVPLLAAALGEYIRDVVAGRPRPNGDREVHHQPRPS